MNKDAKKNTVVTINKESVALPKATMTEDNLKEIELRIDTVFSTARRSTVDIAECVGIINKYNGFVLEGYATIKEYCMEKYNIKETQAKQMVRIFDRYAIESKDGYRVPDDLKEFGAEKLDIIQRFPNFPKQGSVVDLARETIASLGLTPSDNVGAFKTALKTAQGKPIEDKQTKEKESQSEDSITTQLKKANDEKDAKLGQVGDVLAEMLSKAKDDAISDEEFRQYVIDTISNIH